jgi:hypothetical protein
MTPGRPMMEELRSALDRFLRSSRLGQQIDEQLQAHAGQLTTDLQERKGRPVGPPSLSQSFYE